MQTAQNDMPANTRAKMAELLNARLADALDLYSHAKHAHWNIKGPNFAGLHELFDTLADQAESHADDLAERAVQLGSLATGTARHVAATSKLPAFRAETTSWAALTDQVAHSLSAYCRAIREAIDIAAASGDAGTADLFTQISREADKTLWMVTAHLQGDQPR